MADVEPSNNPTPTPTPVPSPPVTASAEEINIDVEDDIVESTSPAKDDVLEMQKQKNKDRAKRFGVEYREPSKDLFVPLREPRRYKNKNSSGFVTGIDLTSEEEKLRREKRAAKFNVTTTEESKPDDNLPAGEGMDVDLRESRKDVPDNVARKMDTLHMYGTDKMSTDDVFKYFIDYGPTHVEWIDDSSCNVIFADAVTAIRALKGLAEAPVDTAPANGDAVPSQVVAFDIGIGWYAAKKASNDSHILLRFATADDVKPLVPKPSVWSRPPRKSYKTGKSKRKQGKGQQQQQQQQPRGDDNVKTTRKKRNSRNRKPKEGGDVTMNDIPETPEELEKKKQRRLRFGLEKPTDNTDSTTTSTDTTSQ